MNTIRMRPLAKALKLAMWNGLNQERLGVRWPGGALPFPTFTSAVIDSTSSITSSMPSSAFWKFADTSMPR